MTVLKFCGQITIVKLPLADYQYYQCNFANPLVVRHTALSFNFEDSAEMQMMLLWCEATHAHDKPSLAIMLLPYC